MKKIASGLLIVFLGMLAGCAMPSSQMGYALIRSTVEPVAATSVENSTKMGKACATNILGLISAGDFSINKAKANGNITKVASVDVTTSSFAVLFGSKCTIVRGS